MNLLHQLFVWTPDVNVTSSSRRGRIIWPHAVSSLPCRCASHHKRRIAVSRAVSLHAVRCSAAYGLCRTNSANSVPRQVISTVTNVRRPGLDNVNWLIPKQHHRQCASCLSTLWRSMGGDRLFHSFLSLVLDGGEWLSLRPGLCTYWKRAPGGLGGTQNRPGRFGEENIPSSWCKYYMLSFVTCMLFWRGYRALGTACLLRDLGFS
jgi:hypothetical protein